ncbi:MAG: 30S ribosomal protein S20 [Chloroflexi bacterium]|nr:30S ribosomal protein S20 [Chloroflexota bacterium]
MPAYNKSHRVDLRRRDRNKPVSTATRHRVVSARKAIESDSKSPQATAALKQAVKGLAQAASKGVIKKNNASRRISRLMKAYNRAQKSA